MAGEVSGNVWWKSSKQKLAAGAGFAGLEWVADLS
jgi:hypothetical protein